VVRALRTPDGPAVLRLSSVDRETVTAAAEGPGAEWALVHEGRGLAGADDDPAAFAPRDDAVATVCRRARGVRLTRTSVMPVLFAAILEQKVTGREARAAWRRLVFATSERAPGDTGLWLPPDPSRVAALPYPRFHTFGVERRRAEVIRSVAARTARIEAFATSAALRAWLERLPGIGPWTGAEVARLSFGDPDAVSVGDYHLPNLVAWVLAGEPRGNDDRMLELMEPYRGQRGRLQGLLEASGLGAPAYGPRTEVRSFARW
jgi:3-methyladenine DNA glycosylase/8-oxoguanine DNA glycosylase